MLNKFKLFNFSKISRYSPSEAGKIYDKTMQRRSNSLFDPKATITLLKENRQTMAVQSDDDRAELVQRYLDVSFLLDDTCSTFQHSFPVVPLVQTANAAARSGRSRPPG